MRLLLLATLFVVGSSFARADIFNIDSSWTKNAAINGDLDTYTGDGTFSWNGTAFSLIDFQFIETSSEVNYVTSYTPTVLWTANANDGEFFAANTDLVIGDGKSDCSGPSCISVIFPSAVTTGSTLLTLNGTGGSTQDPNTNFVSATLTDIYVPEPNSVVLLLTVLMAVGFMVRQKCFPGLRKDLRDSNRA
jgi:hypothetical protein